MVVPQALILFNLLKHLSWKPMLCLPQSGACPPAGYLRLHGRPREGQGHIHVRRVGSYRRVNGGTKLRKWDNLLQPALGKAKEEGVDIDILPASHIGVEACSVQSGWRHAGTLACPV